MYRSSLQLQISWETRGKQPLTRGAVNIRKGISQGSGSPPVALTSLGKVQKTNYDVGGVSIGGVRASMLMEEVVEVGGTRAPGAQIAPGCRAWQRSRGHG